MLDIDIARLTSYLEEHIAGFRGPLEVYKFTSGQSNPTYKLTTPSGAYVLRRKPFGELLKSAHAVEREYRVMAALAESDVPVPHMHLLCEDREVIGSPFFIMGFVEGRVLFDPRLPKMTPDERGAIYDEMNRVVSALATLDITALGLEDYGRTGNYFARQISRWSKQYLASETESIPAMHDLMAWLPEHVPEASAKPTLIHGDFRLDNMLFHPQEPRVLALIDWELSTLGDPLADLSYQCTQWRFPRDTVLPGLVGLDLEVLGIPKEHDYIARFSERTGLDVVSDWPFYVAFNFFRFAAIAQGVKKRALDGNASASSEYALKVGGMARPVAELGAQVIFGKEGY